MIRPDEQMGKEEKVFPASSSDRDYWMYFEDHRRFHPRLWRARVRIHARAYCLAFSAGSLENLAQHVPMLIPEVLTKIHEMDPHGVAMPRQFTLQLPLVPNDVCAADFRGVCRGWFSLGVVERVA
jgi:hypothetical protein